MSRRASDTTRRRARGTDPPAALRPEFRFPPGPLLRAVEELDDAGLRRDHARRVVSARVVFAHHEVLQHDFPSLKDAALLRRHETLRRLPGAARREALRRAREDWLLEHAGVVSVTQAGQTAVNTPIHAAGEAREVWRPTRYGRGLVVAADTSDGADGEQHGGLLDLKGAGVAEGREPSLRYHSSGLCTLGEVLREFLFQSLIDEIFRRAAPCFWTVPIYAVVDLGFDARGPGGESMPAGLLVRRAHRRQPGGRELPTRFSVEEQTQVEIELLLRHYGLTSSNRGTRFRFEEGADGPRVFYAGDAVTDLSPEDLRAVRARLRGAVLPSECDGINIQMARGVELAGASRAQLVDFGHYEMRGRFADPLVSLVCDQPLRWGAAIRPGEPAFVQPSPELCLPESKWGFGRLPPDRPGRPRRSEGEGPSVLARGLARDFRAGRLTGEEVRQQLTRFIADSIAGW